MPTKIENLESLLQTDEFTYLQTIGIELHNEKKRFDFLSVFDELIDENAWSRLFAYLFSSKKEHGLGQSAIREWLNLGIETNKHLKDFLIQLPAEEKSEVNTLTEWYTETGRRLDILIKIQDNRTGEIKGIIGIENKVESGEQIKQISDYQKSLTKTFPNKPILIFFLTPDGRQPKTSLSNKDCPCISYSYRSIIEVCEKLKVNSNGQLNTFLSILEHHISKLIKFNKMEKNIRDTINKLYQNPKYSLAIKLIGEYAPNIRFVFEELREHFKKTSKELDIPLVKFNYDESDSYLTSETCEFQLYFDDFENMYGVDYSPRFILHYNGANPDIGDELFVRLMLYYDYPKGSDRKSKQELRNKVLTTSQFPNSTGEKKHWWQWINIWVSEGYILKDLGNQDIEGLSNLLCKSIRQTFIPLKSTLKKLSET